MGESLLQCGGSLQERLFRHHLEEGGREGGGGKEGGGREGRGSEGGREGGREGGGREEKGMEGGGRDEGGREGGGKVWREGKRWDVHNYIHDCTCLIFDILLRIQWPHLSDVS